MLGKVFGIMCILSVLFGALNGNLPEVGEAVFEGAEAAVELTFSLVGIMCFWCGVMRVLTECGAVRFLSRILSPLLRFFFTDAYRRNEGCEEISASVGANLLGIGNAATPLALNAIKKLHGSSIKNGGDPRSASRDMITLAVLNTAPANLLPTTIIALRRNAGSENPFAAVVPIWICSFTCAFLALILTKALGMREGRR